MTDNTKIIVQLEGKPLLTPQKNPLCAPTQALADAMADEWKAAQPPSAKPLTTLACTAIDRIAPQREGVIEALMVYLDTDTLSYIQAAEEGGELAKRQRKDWKPVLDWASHEFGAIWQTTSGIDAATQLPAMHEAVRAYLHAQDDWRLSAACQLAAACSSLVLTLAVLHGRMSAQAAYGLSCLEQEVQEQRWGKDDEAESKKARVKAEMQEITRFLRLLEDTKTA
jgi:chaperone required for assembly of F1-ATPase